uniref:Uncharacterized protein n=1 Tax=Steinernema glaseri TaxID=37863 RepID=A0A1I7YG56_9BILA
MNRTNDAKLLPTQKTTTTMSITLACDPSLPRDWHSLCPSKATTPLSQQESAARSRIVFIYASVHTHMLQCPMIAIRSSRSSCG